MQIASHRRVWVWVGIFIAVASIILMSVVFMADAPRETRVLVGAAPVPPPAIQITPAVQSASSALPVRPETKASLPEKPSAPPEKTAGEIAAAPPPDVPLAPATEASKAAATQWRKKLATIAGPDSETRYATVLGGRLGGQIGSAGTLGKLLPFDDKPDAPIASAAPPPPPPSIAKTVPSAMAAESAPTASPTTAAPAAPPPPPATAQPTAPPAASASADDAACREKMRRLGVVNPGPCIDVSDIVENLARGKYLFNKPKTAYVGEQFRVMLVLQTASGQDARSLFPATAGEVTEREGRFAQSLEATLGGDDVKVEPSGPQARTATMAEAVQWEWILTPQSGGQKTMVIEVAATIHAGPDKHRVQVTTLREPIVIQVGVVQQIKLYLAEVNGVAAAIVALFTTLGGLFGFVPPLRRFVLKHVGHADRDEAPNKPA